MNLGRKLAIGVGSWVQFEYQCHRSHLFSEKYLSFAIGQILNSMHGENVHAEVNHPVLAPVMQGKGRRPQVDFAVLSPYPDFKYAIETKWYGESRVSLSSIAWDLLRLALLAASSQCKCYFLLGGKRRDLERLFSGGGFGGPNNERLLPLLPGDKSTIRIASPNDYIRRLYWQVFNSKLFKSYRKVRIPASFHTQAFEPFPKTCKQNEYQIYVWQIKVQTKLQYFATHSHKFY